MAGGIIGVVYTAHWYGRGEYGGGFVGALCVILQPEIGCTCDRMGRVSGMITCLKTSGHRKSLGAGFHWGFYAYGKNTYHDEQANLGPAEDAMLDPIPDPMP